MQKIGWHEYVITVFQSERQPVGHQSGRHPFSLKNSDPHIG